MYSIRQYLKMCTNNYKRICDKFILLRGFGSLDSNSLEQAIETLNDLTTGNRLVGIISHVSELKDRIDKKILIEKSMEGSSLMLINA